MIRQLGSLSIFAVSAAFVLSENAVAQNIAFLAQERIPVIVALRCDGGPLQLSQTKHWTAAGWTLSAEVATAAKAGDFSAMQVTAYQVADRLSKVAAFMLFKQDLTGPTRTAEFDPKAGFTARALQLPATAEGCAVVPVAVDMSRVRKGAPYVVDESSFHQLSVVDQLITKLLMNGTRSEILRYLLDANSSQGTDAERIAKARLGKAPTLVLGGYEYELGNKIRTHENGKLAVGEFNFDLEQRFRSSGLVLFARGPAPRNFVMKAEADQPFTRLESSPENSSENMKETLKCRTAQYLSNGFILACDGKIFDGEKQIASDRHQIFFSEEEPEKPWFYEDEVRRKVNQQAVTSIDYSIAPSTKERTSTAVIELIGLSKKITSIQRLVGDSACSGIPFTNKSFTAQERKEWDSEPGPLYTVKFNLPAACREGAVRLTFGK